MKLIGVVLQNFRSYRERTFIPIDQLTAFIGRNDAGKSTVLEALDIFFEGGTVKIDPGDASVGGESANVRIGAVFDNLPPTLNLDAGAETSLTADHLLNEDGKLEVFKKYNCSVSGRVPAPKVFAVAMHPSKKGVENLLQQKNADLKKLVKDAGVEANCNQNNNPSMRQALYEVAGNLALTRSEVPLNDADAKNIWESVKRSLPVFVLFQSDRASRAQDPEVQSPMKLAVQKALAEIAEDLEEISGKVQKMAEEAASRTLDQMKASYPEMDLASVLKPRFEKPNWGSVFKLDLEADDGIPLNKRGSGVRRLVLLSFFQAEAKRIRNERVEGGANDIPVIYAIEEPETSQHPEHQERIISAFREISEGGDQVILTTHVPALAGLLPVESLRFIDLDPDSGLQRIRGGTDEVFAEVAEALGVLPDAAHQERVRVAVAVEGPTDIDALISFADVLSEAGEINDFDSSRVFWTMGGGSTLKDWVDRRYLDSLKVPQIYIFDSDQTSSVLPPSQEKLDQIAAINARDNCKAFLSKKRTIENYMATAAVERVSEGKIQIDGAVHPDFGNMADAFSSAVRVAREAHGQNLNFNPIDHRGRALRLGKSKKIITSYIMKNMTVAEILARGNYETEDGNTENEILEWLQAIGEHLVA